jgi:hypothetical protein
VVSSQLIDLRKRPNQEVILGSPPKYKQGGKMIKNTRSSY